MSSDDHIPSVRPENSDDVLQEDTFAASAGPQNDHSTARFYGQMDTPENRMLFEVLMDIYKLNHRLQEKLSDQIVHY